MTDVIYPNWRETLRKAVADHDELKALVLKFEQLALEMASLRAQTAGKPVINQEAHAELTRIRSGLAPFANMHALGGEARGVAVLDTMLVNLMSTVTDVIGTDIKSIFSQFAVGGIGRVDRAVLHNDGQKLTLIEVKDCTSPRQVVSGIGQALYYKAVLERTTSYSPIVPVLAALQSHDKDIARACELAEVGYIALGDIAFTRAMSRMLCAAVFETE